MPEPEWARAGVTPPGKFGPLGDPTRWGAQVTQRYPAQAASEIGIYRSGQILSAQCQDRYSRAWSIAGVVSAPNTVWSTFPDGLNPLFFPDGWTLAAFVSMGVGQTQIVHNFNLRAIIAADEPYYWNSNIQNPFFEAIGDNVLSKPFIIPGAVVGNSVNVQIVSGLVGSGGTTAFDVTTTILVNPFDPGAK
jgi:hypothetical protein